MANQQALSEDEIQLRRRARRRLIGAITLVTVMVVTLPMVLDGESKQPGQDIVITIPPPASSGEFSSRIVPITEQPMPKPGQQPAPAVAPPPPSPAGNAVSADVPAAPVVVQSQPAIKKTETPPAKTEVKPPAETAAPVPAIKAKESQEKKLQEKKPEDKKPVAAASEAQPKPKEASPAPNRKDEKSAARQDGGPFVIQLGAFSSPANAKDRQTRLTALKVKFYTETVKTPGGDRLRVRAGPYATRHDAERVLAKLKAAGIKDGVVAEKKN